MSKEQFEAIMSKDRFHLRYEREIKRAAELEAEASKAMEADPMEELLGGNT